MALLLAPEGAFVAASVRLGKHDVEGIAAAVDQEKFSLADVKKYPKAFWAKGPAKIAAWPRIARQHEKAEEDRTCTKRWMKVLGDKVALYGAPWEQLELRRTQGQGLSKAYKTRPRGAQRPRARARVWKAPAIRWPARWRGGERARATSSPRRGDPARWRARRR